MQKHHDQEVGSPLLQSLPPVAKVPNSSLHVPKSHSEMERIYQMFFYRIYSFRHLLYHNSFTEQKTYSSRPSCMRRQKVKEQTRKNRVMSLTMSKKTYFLSSSVCCLVQVEEEMFSSEKEWDKDSLKNCVIFDKSKKHH